MNINDYKTNDGIKLLLDISNEKDLTIINIRKREIELLKIILSNEEKITSLIKYIGENIDFTTDKK